MSKKTTVLVAGVNEFGEYLPPVEIEVTSADDPQFEQARQVALERLNELASRNFGLTNPDNGISDVHFDIALCAVNTLVPRN